MSIQTFNFKSVILLEKWHPSGCGRLSCILNMQIMTGIEVNSEADLPKLREYCPSAEGTWAIFPQLRQISLTTDR